jgi:hypothetical protein
MPTFYVITQTRIVLICKLCEGSRFVAVVSQSRHLKKVTLDSFKKLVSTIEKSQLDWEISILSRHHHADPNILIEIEIYRNLSRFTKNLDKFWSRSRSSIYFKDAGFVYESLQIETNRVIWDFCFHETNPRYKSLRFGFANLQLQDS